MPGKHALSPPSSIAAGEGGGASAAAAAAAAALAAAAAASFLCLLACSRPETDGGSLRLLCGCGGAAGGPAGRAARGRRRVWARQRSGPGSWVGHWAAAAVAAAAEAAYRNRSSANRQHSRQHNRHSAHLHEITGHRLPCLIGHGRLNGSNLLVSPPCPPLRGSRRRSSSRLARGRPTALGSTGSGTSWLALWRRSCRRRCWRRR